jgi:hypothetical protein
MEHRYHADSPLRLWTEAKKVSLSMSPKAVESGNNPKL